MNGGVIWASMTVTGERREVASNRLSSSEG